MKRIQNIKMRYLIFLIPLALIVYFQNCDSSGPTLQFSSLQQNAQGGTGDGFDGKPRVGDWIRSFPDYTCPSTSNAVQAQIFMLPTTGQILNDNCKTTNIEISLKDPQLDFAFYNPNYFTFAGSIFEIFDSKIPFHVNESLCRFRGTDKGVDAVITVTNGTLSANIFAGIYDAGRAMTSRSYGNITKTQNSTSTVYRNSDNTMTLVINGTAAEYKNLSGTLHTNVGGETKNYQVNCQKMSEQPVLTTPSVNFATYYIDRNTGSDANDGLTESKAFFSIPRCATVVKAGDTCAIKDGTYTENILLTTHGTPTARVTFKNFFGHRPKINFTDTSLAGRWEMANVVYNSAPFGYVTIEGLEISGGKADAMKIYFPTEILIKNNYFHDNDYGMALNLMLGYRVRVEGNRFNHNGHASNGSAIALHGQQHVIVNNIFEDTLGQALSLAAYPFDSTKFNDPLYFDLKDSIISNNTFANNQKMAILPWGQGGAGGTVANNKIQNNIFYENCRSACVAGHGQAISYWSPAGSGDLITNNIFYATGSVTTAIGFGGGVGTPAQQYTESGSLFNNPLFVGAADFHLQSTSPAVNAGLNLLPTVTIDYDSNPRPRGGAFDIGAYEY
jgi:hypothetical protein